ncbi:MAG: hypothetical protein JRI68_13360 [Deltaproteobacteria bacterium]|nr:hypothetical protein [Deltaproteobacteria bacterium]
MKRRFTKTDWRLLVLVVAHGVGIAGFIGAEQESVQAERSGWRKVDQEALMEKIRAGDLVQHEADWYRVVPDETGRGEGQPGR